MSILQPRRLLALMSTTNANCHPFTENPTRSSRPLNLARKHSIWPRSCRDTTPTLFASWTPTIRVEAWIKLGLNGNQTNWRVQLEPDSGSVWIQAKTTNLLSTLSKCRMRNWLFATSGGPWKTRWVSRVKVVLRWNNTGVRWFLDLRTTKKFFLYLHVMYGLILKAQIWNFPLMVVNSKF